MPLPLLTTAEQDELNGALRAVQQDFARVHRRTRAALFEATPEELHEALGAWLDVFFVLADEVTAWSVAAEQAGIPALSTPTELPRFAALAAHALAPDAARALLAASDELEEARVLALAVLIAAHPQALADALMAELARTRDVQATWVLLDWFDADAHVLAELASHRRRMQHAVEEAREGRGGDRARHARQDDATRWLVQRGFEPTEPFQVRIRMQDVPPRHPRQSHLREQVSTLEVAISTKHARGPTLDPSWTIILRGSPAEPLHGFTPSRWEGSFGRVQSESGEVQAEFVEPSASPVRKPRRHSLALTLESIPRVIDALEVLTGRSFHRECATITASIGEQRAARLEEVTRAWLAAR